MKILFVCSGNTCRSPMAEGYLNSLKPEGVEALSAGLQAGGYVSENSVAAMADMGIDISRHVPRQITRQMCCSADKIICMTATHKALLELSGVTGDISVLGFGISDPYGADTDAYIACRNEIVNEIDKILSSVNIRGYVNGDEKKIAALERECFSAPWSEKAITDAVNNGTQFLVAEKGLEFAGYISLNTAADEGYINNIAVAEKFRRQGIAEKLLSALARKAEKAELAFLSLEVRESNGAAVKLYEKCGYENMGVRKNFYENPRENAIIMTKTMRD